VSNEIGFGSALVELIGTFAERAAGGREASDGLLLREKTLRELTDIRGDASSSAFTDAVRQVFGVKLPAIPNTVAIGPTHTALWLGPDEWLLQSNDARLPLAERTFRARLRSEVASVVDVSSGYVVLDLEGARVREILQKGCPLDLHPRVFGIGRCAQSHFFGAAIVLRPLRTNAYELIVRRSFADYAVRMLLDAAEL
jgi:sarcosine oxidase subunit gamma